jgi:hypothetical protein
LKILAPAENRITIELSARDMDALNITYEQMDYSNIETRRVVWTLLDRAGHELKRDIDPSGRMIIEAVPAGRGGCILKFTLCADGSRAVRTPSIKKGENTAVYEFCSLDAVMDAAHALGGRCESGGLYESEGRYRLLMGESPTDAPEHILSEFGTPIDSPFSASHTREHWRCISESDALKRLFGG